MKILCFHATPGNPVEFVIKLVTRSKYCHAAILIDNESWYKHFVKQSSLPAVEAPLVVEAVYPKVRARHLQKNELDEIDVYDVPSFDGETTAMEWLSQQVGLTYDIADLIRFVPIGRHFTGESTDEAYKQHTFCSMLVFNAYRFAGLRLLNCHDYECSPAVLPWSPYVVRAGRLQ